MIIITKNIPINYGIIFIFTQIIAGIFGCLTANWYFEYPIIEWSLNERVGVFKFFSEIIATVGLLLTIFILKEVNKERIAIGVALFINRRILVYFINKFCKSSSNYRENVYR